jgi:hypothetical protein
MVSTSSDVFPGARSRSAAEIVVMNAAQQTWLCPAGSAIAEKSTPWRLVHTEAVSDYTTRRARLGTHGG